ncbi:MAG: phosphotransferase, partial [Nitrospinota bacterium]
MPNNTEFEKLLPPFIKDALGPGHRLVQTELLQGDASQRTYFRVTTEETLTQTQKSYIVMHSNQVDSELNSFIDVHKALTHLEIPVPALFYSDKASGLLLEEDCGDWTLEQFSKTISEKEVDSLYKKALDILVRMQFGDRHNTFTCIAYTRYFDAEKFMQELNFMRTHLLEGLAGHRVEATDLRKITKAFNALCMELAREPRVFTHRDFHIKNLMVQQNGKVQVLDFQDARMGPCQYDLVSLLN